MDSTRNPEKAGSKETEEDESWCMSQALEKEEEEEAEGEDEEANEDENEDADENEDEERLRMLSQARLPVLAACVADGV